MDNTQDPLNIRTMKIFSNNFLADLSLTFACFHVIMEDEYAFSLLIVTCMTKP